MRIEGNKVLGRAAMERRGRWRKRLRESVGVRIHLDLDLDGDLAHHHLALSSPSGRRQ